MAKQTLRHFVLATCSILPLFVAQTPSYTQTHCPFCNHALKDLRSGPQVEQEEVDPARGVNYFQNQK